MLRLVPVIEYELCKFLLLFPFLEWIIVLWGNQEKERTMCCWEFLLYHTCVTWYWMWLLLLSARLCWSPEDWKQIYKISTILKSRTLQRLWSQFCQPITHLYVTLNERSIFTGSLRLKSLIENFLWVKLLEWNFGFSSLQVKWEEPANNWSKMVARINLKERNWLRSGHKERAALGISYMFISIKEMWRHETRHELIKRASFGSS